MRLAATTAMPPYRAPSPDQAHLTQYPSRLVPDAVAWGNSNCGPVAALIATRLLGLELPGVAPMARTQAAIDAARLVATGRIDQDEATTKAQQERVLLAAGASVTRTRSLERALDAARAGAVLVVGGDRGAPGWPPSPMDARAGETLLAGSGAGPVMVREGHLLPLGHRERPHAAVVSSWVAALDRFVVNDPALPAPVLVSPAQLASFTQLGAGARGVGAPDRMPRDAIVAWRR